VPSFFPQTTIEWRMEEPAAFRRLSLSLPEMALITGVVLRLLRALSFTYWRASWSFYGVILVVGILLLLGMTTAHLANFPTRSWTWRAPLFSLVEVVGEMATSLLLIAVRREPEGTARADFHDWPSMSVRAKPSSSRFEERPMVARNVRTSSASRPTPESKQCMRPSADRSEPVSRMAGRSSFAPRCVTASMPFWSSSLTYTFGELYRWWLRRSTSPRRSTWNVSRVFSVIAGSRVGGATDESHRESAPEDRLG
jgi:hypothetical protein